MVSSTTESTAQSTPSLIGQRINVSVRSFKSIGNNNSRRRDDASKKSPRSQASRTNSKKSTCSSSRKSRLSRTSSLYDDESLEPRSVEDSPHSVSILPSPPLDEISVCASSTSCKSGRSLRLASESGSSVSCRSGSGMVDPCRRSSYVKV